MTAGARRRRRDGQQRWRTVTAKLYGRSHRALRRREEQARRFLTHVAYCLAQLDPAYRHYYEKIERTNLGALLERAEYLQRVFGPHVVWGSIHCSGLFAYRPMLWSFAAIPVFVLYWVLAAVLPNWLWSPPLVAGTLTVPLCLLSTAVSNRLSHRFARRFTGPISGPPQLPTFTSLGPSAVRLLRRHAAAVPALTLTDPAALPVLHRELGPFSDDAIEIALSLADEFDGTARELLHTAERLAHG